MTRKRSQSLIPESLKARILELERQRRPPTILGRLKVSLSPLVKRLYFYKLLVQESVKTRCLETSLAIWTPIWDLLNPLPQLRQCSKSCVNSFSTSCSQANFHCVCSDTTYINGMRNCFTLHCNEKDRNEAVRWLDKICKEPGNGIKGEPNRIFRNLRGINLYDIEKRQIDGGSSTASAGISSPTGHATTLSSRTGSAVNGIPTGDATTSSSPAGSATNGIPTHSPAGTLSAGGLSSYAKIGIGLGVPLGVLIIGILIFLGYFIGKRRRKTPRYTDSNALPAELVEIGGRERPVAELPTEVNMVELPGSFQSRGSQDKIKTSDVPHSEATLES